MIQFFRKLYYALPVQLRFLSRIIVYFPLDLISYKSRKAAGIPPKGKLFIGSGDFVLTGNRFAERLQEYCDLKATSKVLDIGCGIGRLARPLTKILNEEGKYAGFDVVKSGINWCQKNISSKHQNFEFIHVDLSNDLYTTGGEDASSFNFPYQDQSFSIAVAISVYTHLLPEETNRYLAETARILEPGGLAFFTFFIQDNNSILPNKFNFPIKHENYALMDEKVSRANVLYKQDFLHKMIEQNGLEIKQWIKGRWCNEDGLDYQDSLVLLKR